jgi:hypothetical protein
LKEQKLKAISGPIFSTDDMRRAFDALDAIFQDNMPVGPEVRCVESKFWRELQKRGITLALAKALIEELIGEQVLRPRTDGILHGDIQQWTSLDGSKVVDLRSVWSRFLFLDVERWYAYRNQRVQVRQAESEATTGTEERGQTSAPVNWRQVGTLKELWGPLFGDRNYVKLGRAVRKSPVPWRNEGRKLLVDEAAFLRWMDLIKDARRDAQGVLTAAQLDAAAKAYVEEVEARKREEAGAKARARRA